MIHISGCAKSKQDNLQELRYQEALSYIILHGCSPPSCYLSCSKIRQFRNISADKRDYGCNCASSDGYSLRQKVMHLC